MPEQGGSVELLRGFLNVDDATWRLILSWLVATLRPRGPYPVLALFAEQGSDKSTMGRLLRELVDPNAAPLRAEPKDSRDLMIAANNAWWLAYDNLSRVPPWLSDAFCRLSTGGGFATRELFTDQEEVIFDSQRPVLLTGIEEVAKRSDLLDRCLVVWLPEIPKEQRRTEAELFETFQTARPLILGALLDAVVVALQRLPSIERAGLPRMADFALWGSAAETAFGWPAGTFLATYQGNRASTNELAIEASVVAGPLVELIEREGQWVGSSGELLSLLEDRIGDRVRHLVGWPKNARALAGHLKRLSPNLRTAGWAVRQDRNSKKRLWIIGRSQDANGVASSPSSGPSQKDECKSMHSQESWCETCRHDANDANDANAGRPWNLDRY
jgi:hypothetical protein